MNSIEIMNEEHKNILRMLKVVRSGCMKILKGNEICFSDFNLMIDFIKIYADEHHHKKEEKILFKEMMDNLGDIAEKVVKHGMMVEHDWGRLYIQNLCEALEKVKVGDEEAKLDVIANAISYTHLLERHIDKEDRVIYKFAQRELDQYILDMIDNECINFENSNKDIKEKSIKILKELERKYIK